MRESSLLTRISVPADDVEPLMDALADSGLTVLDSGERITTEGALEGEATLHVLDLPADGPVSPEREAPRGSLDRR